MYMARTMFPTCLLVRIEEVNSSPSRIVLMVGRLEPFDLVPDRLGIVPDWTLGARAAEVVGL